MTHLLSDPSLYRTVLKRNHKCIEGADAPERCVAVYVEDSLLTGNENFRELTEATFEKFE